VNQAGRAVRKSPHRIDEDDESRGIFDGIEPAELVHLARVFFEFRAHAALNFVSRNPGQNAIHAHVPLPELARHRLRQSDHPRFRSRVVRLANVPDARGERANVDDVTGALLYHLQCRGLRAEKSAAQARCHHTVPLLGRHGRAERVVPIASIVNQEIDVRDGGKKPLNLRRRIDIQLLPARRVNFPAGFPQFIGDCARKVALAARDHCHALIHCSPLSSLILKSKRIALAPNDN
jgi:hypothetical protein